MSGHYQSGPMTARHFEAISKALADASGDFDTGVYNLTQLFSRWNTRFDCHRFLYPIYRVPIDVVAWTQGRLHTNRALRG
jgi:hypothetical protein